ncbi:MAG TPA: PEP-utilizing enzyme [Mycobacterium sp.]|nr:PEP-utilizing enzyme [Mycobacterium sp.]
MRVLVTGLQDDVICCVRDELTRRGHELPPATAEPAKPIAAACVLTIDPDDTGPAGGQGVPPRRTVVISTASVPVQIADDLDGEFGARPQNSLLVQAPTVLGRASAGAVQRRFAGPMIIGVAGQPNRLQVVHHDDLARFAVDAVEHPDWTGRVNLAAVDDISLREVAEILAKPYLELDPRLFGALSGLRLDYLVPAGPRLATAGLGGLGFTPAWASGECVGDFGRTNRRHIYFGPVRMPIPWRFPWTPIPPPPHGGSHRHRAGRAGVNGEFDTSIDPRWPEFTCANVAEAFPGPMTPLSLELAMEAMRATGLLAADIAQLTGGIRQAVTEEHVGCFGHSVYVNLTVARAASAMLPGANSTAWRDLLFGAGSGVDAAPSADIGLWGVVRRLPKIAVLLGGAGTEAGRIEREAREQQRDAAYYAACTDETLLAQLGAARDAVASTWAGAALGSAGVVPIMGLIERLGGKHLASQFKGGTEKLASAGLIRGTYGLAACVRADPALAAILEREDGGDALRLLRSEHSDFASRLDAVIAEYGHRGPRETELSSMVFADAPARLLDAVAKLARAPQRPAAPPPSLTSALRLLAHFGAGFQQAREQVRDAAVRYTHDYRLIARELGARLADRAVIEQPDDVFYLVRAELAHPPADIKTRVARRRAERKRLETCRPPMHFSDRWEPRRDTAGELEPGESLTGIAASAGLAKGFVRILTADSVDDLQPGEVLVAEYTDVGWTPFFAHAAAVVVDTGAEMSHAAVIAREFNIPCVVGSLTATRSLRTGQVIEVDGSTGRVTRVE